jgi:hypothetical protein
MHSHAIAPLIVAADHSLKPCQLIVKIKVIIQLIGLKWLMSISGRIVRGNPSSVPGRPILFQTLITSQPNFRLSSAKHGNKKKTPEAELLLICSKHNQFSSNNSKLNFLFYGTQVKIEFLTFINS